MPGIPIQYLQASLDKMVKNFSIIKDDGKLATCTAVSQMASTQSLHQLQPNPVSQCIFLCCYDLLWGMVSSEYGGHNEKLAQRWDGKDWSHRKVSLPFVKFHCFLQQDYFL